VRGSEGKTSCVKLEFSSTEKGHASTLDAKDETSHTKSARGARRILCSQAEGHIKNETGVDEDDVEADR